MFVRGRNISSSWMQPVNLHKHQHGKCYCLWTHPDRLQRLDLLVQAVVDVTWVEQRVSWNLAQQVSGEVADVVLAEVPLSENSAGYDRLGVLVAALAEVAAEVLAVSQSLDVVWGEGSQQKHNRRREDVIKQKKSNCHFCINLTN